MSFIKLPKDARFSNKMIILFIIPILFEQLLIGSLSLADTLMVARLPDSEAALAGIANVSRLDTLFKQIFSAIAAGGSVFISQYIGANDLKKAGQSLKQLAVSLFFGSIVLSVLMMVFRVGILNLLFGSVEDTVMKESLQYYTYTIASYPFMALFNIGTASFRAMKKSKITLLASVLMMSINISLKYVFLFYLKMGVIGAGLSLVIAYAVTGIGLVLLLMRKNNLVYIDNILKPEWDLKMLGGIYRLALPTGIENGMFQLGSLLLQSLIASLGTVAINANHIANNISYMTYAAASAFTLGILPFVGQCMGAKKPDEAEFYIKHILKLDRIILAVLAVFAIVFTPQVVSIFGISEEASVQTVRIARLYFLCTPLFYPESFALANALRGTGDTKFPMVVSITDMFVLRVGGAYLMVKAFSMGIISIWIVMVSDWFVRAVIFSIRFKHGSWKQNRVIGN